MFDSVLVANRGEIAIRVIGALRALGMRSIAVFSQADAGAPHAREADLAVPIGASEARHSYLSVPALLEAAQRTGAEAVHPGYGFLSESAAFARACRDAGLVFVGPSPEVIELMGDKARAKQLARDVGIPVVPGVGSEEPSAVDVVDFGRAHGLPIMIKAVAGGGGRGMRVVSSLEQIPEDLEAARREAEAAFGDGRVMVERKVEMPRHIEVQILADRQGEVIQLGDRECSLQRRHQKVIEEAPAPSIDAELRDRILRAAVSLARACHYEGAGTVEFLVSGDGAGNEFFFLEMNTRLQVEHPVTEMVHGVDLVEAQLRIAAGEPLGFEGASSSASGHAIEARLYAEDPAAGFLPSTGTVLLWDPPSGKGVRTDAGIETGSQVTAHYDPLLAKVIASGRDRATAIRRLDAALSRTTLLGVRSNQSFLRWLLAREEMLHGALDVGLIERILDEFPEPPLRAYRNAAALAAFAADREEAERASTVPFGWRRAGGGTPWRALIGPHGSEETECRILEEPNREDPEIVLIEDSDGVQTRAVVYDSSPGHLDVELEESRKLFRIERRGNLIWVGAGGHAVAFSINTHREHGAQAGERALVATMPGTVIVIHARNGDQVDAGDPLLALESMKMEVVVSAPHAGTVSDLTVSEGDQVRQGQQLASIVEPEVSP